MQCRNTVARDDPMYRALARGRHETAGQTAALKRFGGSETTFLAAPPPTPEEVEGVARG